MRRLLLNSILLFTWMVMVFFSCSDGGSKEKSGAGSRQDTAGTSRSASGTPVKSGQTNTVSTGKDTALRYRTEIRNNGPDQARIDSIKDAKTKKKK